MERKYQRGEGVTVVAAPSVVGALGMVGCAGGGAAGAVTVTGCLTGMNSGPFWPQPANPVRMTAVPQIRGNRNEGNMDFTIRITV